MEEAFLTGAGFDAHGLQLVIRGLVAALFSLWALWTIYNQFKLVVSEQLSVIQWVFNTVTVTVVYTIVLVIVAN
jgi:integrating conjugative element protein (TIGR03758 family)